MKIRVTLKDPDGFYDSVKEAVKESLKGIGLSEAEVEAVAETRLEETWEKLEKWIEYKEYVDLEFDTEAGTAVIVERE